MSLCIWTAVHLNLPEHKKEHRQKWRKLGWLVMGLLAPEIVAFNAWQQRREVKRLTERMRQLHALRHHFPARRPVNWQDKIRPFFTKLWRFPGLKKRWHGIKESLLLEAGELPPDMNVTLPQTRSDNRDTLVCPWTDLRSWYAIMGGFVFDTSSAPERFFPGRCSRVTLSPEGLLLLAEKWPHLLPDIPETDIKDRSKSDSLAKLITCWQAGWFCIQCIYRLSQGLSISLLELNVFGHAITALCIFLIWWTKPKDIQEPTRICGERANSIAAMFCLLSPMGRAFRSSWKSELFEYGKGAAERIWVPVTVDSETQALPPLPIAHYSFDELYEPHSVEVRSTAWTTQNLGPEKQDSRVPGQQASFNNMAQTTLDPFRTSKRLFGRQWISMDRILAARLGAVREHNTMREILASAQDDRGVIRLDTLVRLRNRNWYLDARFFRKTPTVSMLSDFSAITLATSLYGALHATAWNAAYPSRNEMLLWRTSSLTVALTGPGLVALAIFIIVIVSIAEFAKDSSLSGRMHRVLGSWKARIHWLGPSGREVLRGVLGVILLALLAALTPIALTLCLAIYAIPLAYTAARGFLVVESFINIAHLSQAVLSVPSWSQYVPHVT